MRNKKQRRDMIIVGFALFAMFFGSGNLIFPPFLGREAGAMYPVAIIGFMIMGVGLPLLGIMATAYAGGRFEEITSQIGRTFSIVLMTSLILAIGPLLAIPRTAATTYEISIGPFIPNINPIVCIGLYFIINLMFVLRPTQIVDVIGKFLTPILLIILSILIIKGITHPIGPITTQNLPNVFSSALLEGYQTMDALAAVCFGSIIVGSIRDKGYRHSKDIIKMTLKSSVIAVVGLGVIYGGLMYLGAYTGHVQGAYEKTALVSLLANQILGPFGNLCLGIAVGVACLTTSIGLTATGAEYFSKLLKNRVSYNQMAIVISIVSMGIALLGVDRIVGITGPILNILYPVVIVLIVMTLLGEMRKETVIPKYTLYVTLIFAVGDVIMTLINRPLWGNGFIWVIPAILTFVFTKYKTSCLK